MSATPDDAPRTAGIRGDGASAGRPRAGAGRGSPREGPRPVVAITMGDPAGIGPEVIWGALADSAVYRVCRPLVVADAEVMARAAARLGLGDGPDATGSDAGGMGAGRMVLRRISAPGDAVFEAGILDCLAAGPPAPPPPFGRVDAAAGEAAYRAIVRAVELVRGGDAGAICTAPVHKAALHLAGHRFPGHTELLAHLTGAPTVAMMLVAPRLRVVHATTHVGLVEAVARITPERVAEVIRMGDAALRRMGFADARIGVCGVNPHAGEGGLFGAGEEEERIRPGVRMACAEGIRAEGPLPADSLFPRAVHGEFDLVVAMYHDQGHIPVKVLGFAEGVNVTLGLPLVRTSPDHGTAFDIAGTGRADPGAMRGAILAAAEYAAGGLC